MLLLWLEDANFKSHYVVQGSNVAEPLFKPWINIDVNYKFNWLKWCIWGTNEYSNLQNPAQPAVEKHMFMHFCIDSRCEKYHLHDLKPLALFPHLKRSKSVTLAAGWNHHGKSAIQVKICKASREQMGRREARMTTFHQNWCLMAKEPLREISLSQFRRAVMMVGGIQTQEWPHCCQ